MVWYSHLFQNFPQLIVIHTVKGFGIINKAEIDAFLELSCFFSDPADVGNLISGSSAFSKTSLKSGSSRFTYYCSLAWRILSITLLARWVQLCGSLSILWHCLPLRLEWKLTELKVDKWKPKCQLGETCDGTTVKCADHCCCINPKCKTIFCLLNSHSLYESGIWGNLIWAVLGSDLS